MRLEEVDIYRSLPMETLEALDRYLSLGIQPGGAMTAVLRDRLAETFARGDERFLATLRVLVRYLFNCVPGIAWGSDDRVEGWLEMRQDARLWALEHCSHSAYIAFRREQGRQFVQSCRDNDVEDFDGQDG